MFPYYVLPPEMQPELEAWQILYWLLICQAACILLFCVSRDYWLTYRSKKRGTTEIIIFLFSAIGLFSIFLWPMPLITLFLLNLLYDNAPFLAFLIAFGYMAFAYWNFFYTLSKPLPCRHTAAPRS